MIAKYFMSSSTTSWWLMPCWVVRLSNVSTLTVDLNRRRLVSRILLVYSKRTLFNYIFRRKQQRQSKNTSLHCHLTFVAIRPRAGHQARTEQLPRVTPSRLFPTAAHAARRRSPKIRSSADSHGAYQSTAERRRGRFAADGWGETNSGRRRVRSATSHASHQSWREESKEGPPED